jgi:2-iminoacetate synthase ThiH
VYCFWRSANEFGRRILTRSDVSDEIRNLICARADHVLFPGGHNEDYFICNVEADEDASGDEVLFIYLCYQKAGIEPKATLILDLLVEIRKALVSVGEQRFPHIQHVPFEAQALAS